MECCTVNGQSDHTCCLYSHVPFRVASCRLFEQYYNNIDRLANGAGAAGASWFLEPQSDRAVVLRTRSPTFFNASMRFGAANAAGCGPGGNLNLRTSGTDAVSRWNVVDPLWSYNCEY